MEDGFGFCYVIGIIFRFKGEFWFFVGRGFMG